MEASRPLGREVSKLTRHRVDTAAPDPSILGFFYSNGFGFANLDTAFTTETFFRIDRLGFFVLHFKYFYRTNFDAFSTSGAFVLIH
jgi:hypothetical protein